MLTRRTHICAVAIALTFGAAGALAQATSTSHTPARIELSGGYAYQRLNSASGGGVDLHGWTSEMHVNVKGPFAIAGTVGGGYGSQDGADLQLYSFLVGPRFVYRTNRVNLFAHTLVGGARLNASAGGVDDSSTSFAAAIGGGADLRLTPRVSWRMCQADYLLTRFADRSQNNLKLSTGIVIRFGHSAR